MQKNPVPLAVSPLLFLHSQRSPLVSFFVWAAIATATKEDFQIVSQIDKLIDKFLVLSIQVK